MRIVIRSIIPCTMCIARGSIFDDYIVLFSQCPIYPTAWASNVPIKIINWLITCPFIYTFFFNIVKPCVKIVFKLDSNISIDFCDLL